MFIVDELFIKNLTAELSGGNLTKQRAQQIQSEILKHNFFGFILQKVDLIVLADATVLNFIRSEIPSMDLDTVGEYIHHSGNKTGEYLTLLWKRADELLKAELSKDHLGLEELQKYYKIVFNNERKELYSLAKERYEKINN